MIHDDVYELIAGLDPASAQVVAGMIAAEAAPPTEPLAKAYGEFVAAQAEVLRRSVVRQYVAKRAAGEDVDSSVELATAIAKATNGFGFQFQEGEHRRDEHGRFVVMNHRVKYREGRNAMDDDDAEAEGVPFPSRQPGWAGHGDHQYPLTRKQRAAYQQAYLQIADKVSRYRDLPPGMAQLHMEYDDGSHSTHALDPDKNIPIIPDKTLTRAKVTVRPPTLPRRDPQATTFDAVRALTGNPQFAAHVATTNLPTREFLDSLPSQQGEEYTSAAAFRRMRAGADLLTAAAGPFMPAPALMATRTASFVGQYGPQAQKVFGPTVDRAKYRYTGTERKLDPEVTRALKQIKAKYPSDPDAARELMTYGSTQTIDRGPTRPGFEGRDPVQLWHPSPLVTYLKDQLPKQKLSALQRMSGHIPPSQGVIIDRQGRVSAQMVGSGDDWYLPFNLGNLGSLQGGEYLRTRTNGGLTTEDVYTGLMAGARSMSVVSHNGLYTMEFDDTLRGSRRYSSTARDMTERYGQLLDAVKEGNVPANDLDPSVMAEIHDRVGQRINPARNPEEYEDAVRDEIAQQRVHPEASQAMQEEWFNEFLAERASRMSTKSGAPMSVPQMVSEKVIKPYAEHLAAQKNAGSPVGAVFTANDPDIVDEALTRYENNPEMAATMLNAEGDYKKYVSGKLRAYRDSVKPMELNGPGYEFAMEALKEQFPYFISRVKFTPWSDTEPDAGRDYGYVKPRFNRPAAALSGYHDTSILGHGKVSADRTRYQNYGVMQRLGRSHEGNHQTSSSTSSTPEARRDSSLMPNARAGGRSPAQRGGATRQATAAAPSQNARRDADLAYVKHVLAQTHFSKNTKLGDAQGTFGGESVTAHRNAWMGNEHPDYGEDFIPLTHPLSHYESLDDDELHNAALHLSDLNEQHQLFDLDPQIQGRFNRGGAKPTTQDLNVRSLSVAGNAENHDNEYDLGWEFEPGRTRSQYAATFDQDEGLQHAAAAIGVDDLDGDVPGKVTPYQLELQNHMGEWAKWGARHPDGTDDDVNDPPPDYPVDELVNDATNAVRLRQLHRRYTEAGTPPPVINGGGGGGSIAPIKFSGGGTSLPGGSSIPTGSVGRFVPMSIAPGHVGTYSAS